VPGGLARHISERSTVSRPFQEPSRANPARAVRHGGGGEAQLGATIRPGLIQRIRSMDRMETLKGVKQDLTVLKSMWFKKASGSDHAERLESFYGPQAAACELIYAAVSCMLGRIGWLAGSGLSGRLAVCDHIGSHKLIQSLSGALIPRPHV